MSRCLNGDEPVYDILSPKLMSLTRPGGSWAQEFMGNFINESLLTSFSIETYLSELVIRWA